MSRIWPAEPCLRRWRGHREVSWIPKSWTFNNHIEEEIQWKKWPSFSGRSKCHEHWGACGRPANAILLRELSSLTTRKGHIMPLSLPFSRASRQHQHITQALPSRNDASLCLWTLLSPPDAPVWTTYSVTAEDTHQLPNRQCWWSCRERPQGWSLDGTEWKQLTFSELRWHWKCSPFACPIPSCFDAVLLENMFTCPAFYFTVYFCSHLEYLPLYAQIIPTTLLIHIVATSHLSHETILGNLCLITGNTYDSHHARGNQWSVFSLLQVPCHLEPLDQALDGHLLWASSWSCPPGNPEFTLTFAFLLPAHGQVQLFQNIPLINPFLSISTLIQATKISFMAQSPCWSPCLCHLFSSSLSVKHSRLIWARPSSLASPHFSLCLFVMSWPYWLPGGPYTGQLFLPSGLLHVVLALPRIVSLSPSPPSPWQSQIK